MLPHIQLERVNGLRRRLCLIAANRCLRETDLIWEHNFTLLLDSQLLTAPFRYFCPFYFFTSFGHLQLVLASQDYSGHDP
ncbi:hypothetical protein H5410_015729 [Solanum commersonii]|uniref:Uncharacterized protein n=1 Tax=Solanum commersonii TaxID=4109 RepID=A0A9J5ZUJ4_SOLCO|nr:hypothetical protein H5410_015729 [Solanum commersonii]